MDVPELRTDEAIATEEHKRYCKLVKTRDEKYLKEMKSMYWFLKQGKAVINIQEVMKDGGCNGDQDPRFAIARADGNIVHFTKEDPGGGYFSITGGWEGSQDVGITPGTFKAWRRRQQEIQLTNGKTAKEDILHSVERQHIKTKVPVIPAILMPEGKLSSYYILFEVKEWEPGTPPRKDPYLLKRINRDLFAVIGAWDLTDAEKEIIASRRPA